MTCSHPEQDNPKEFRIHIGELTYKIADHLEYKIHNAAFSAAEDVQNAIDEGNDLTEELKHEIAVWKKNLSIDLRTLNIEDDYVGREGLQIDLRAAIREALERLPGRAETLPDPTAAKKLATQIQTKIAGLGFHNTDGEARGKLGMVYDQSVYLRTNRLADWKGPTAETVKVQILANADQGVLALQQDHIDTLAHLSDTNYAAILQARKDLDSIAHAGEVAAYDIADTCRGTHGTDGEADGATATLGMIAGATAIAAAITGGGFAALMASAGGVATYLQNTIDSSPAEDTKYKFSADNWKDLIRKIAAATEDVENALDDVYHSLEIVSNKQCEVIKNSKMLVVAAAINL